MSPLKTERKPKLLILWPSMQPFRMQLRWRVQVVSYTTAIYAEAVGKSIIGPVLEEIFPNPNNPGTAIKPTGYSQEDFISARLRSRLTSMTDGKVGDE